MIVIKDLAKSFGTIKAVQGISMEARDGRVTTLLGANGSGKTTTFNAIFGLMKPDFGGVEVDGILVAKRPTDAQKRMGVFPDKFGLYTRLTAREHLEYYGALHEMDKVSIDLAVADVSNKLGLNDILDRRTEGFSQGQRMKVALARAILHNPKNIILDEPSRGLDVMSIRLLRELLLKLRDEGHCILLSSHVMAEVQRLSDHVVMIADGKVCAEGTTDELISHAGETNLEDAFVALANLGNGLKSEKEGPSSDKVGNGA